MELLRFLAELHCLVWRQPFVHIMQQFHLIAQFLAADLQQLQCAAKIISRLEQRFVVQRLELVVSAMTASHSPTFRECQPAREHCENPGR